LRIELNVTILVIADDFSYEKNPAQILWSNADSNFALRQMGKIFIKPKRDAPAAQERRSLGG